MTDVPTFPTRDRTGARLRVSADGRTFEDQDGVPFLYLADTAWTLFKRLDPGEAERYLSRRAEQGFTVIQAYVVRGLEVRNLEGHLPLVDRDPTRLDEGFFGNIDRIVRRANELGLVMGLVAVMGEHVKKRDGAERYGQRNEQIFDPENARRFGELLGARYRDAAVIWLLGGDRTPSEADIAIWDAMAEGMKTGSQGDHLVSYHSSGGHSSSEYFHGKAWLDFNTTQSRHRTMDPNHELIEIDYALTPVKPTLDMESRYEDHPDASVLDIAAVMRGELDPGDQRVLGFDVREAAYWALFAGAAGHGYGHNDIWQMHDPARADSTRDYSFPLLPPRLPWWEAMEAEGAADLAHVRRLLEARAWYEAEPDQSMLVSPQPGGEDHIQALRARDGRFLLAYLPFGGSVTIDLPRMRGREVDVSWFDPRTGTTTKAARTPTDAPGSFTAPGAGRGEDHVLVLDDPTADLPAL